MTEKRTTVTGCFDCPLVKTDTVPGDMVTPDVVLSGCGHPAAPASYSVLIRFRPPDFVPGSCPLRKGPLIHTICLE